MGIKGLTQLLKQQSPNSIQTINLYKLSGCRVAVDASLFMYKMLINMRSSDKSYLTSSDGSIVSHIVGIFYKTSNYLALNITPIYVFDGAPPKHKREVIQNRQEKAAHAKLAMTNTELTGEQKNNLEKQSIRLTKQHVDDIKHLLDLMGVSYVQAHGEAEAYASEMCRQKFVDYVVTEDMDTLAFGCPKMIRTCLDPSIKRGYDFISVIDLTKVLSDLNMSYEQFIEMCILCGCDYCANIPRIGNKTAFNLISKHGSIEHSLPHIKNVPDDYNETYKAARTLFTEYHDTLDMDQLTIHHSSRDLEALYNYLVQSCSMSDQRVQNAIKKIKQGYK
jgi:flap endonuclease-1